MRILFFIDTLGLGGVIRQLSLLAGGLQKKGHQVSVLALYPVDRDWGLYVGSLASPNKNPL